MLSTLCNVPLEQLDEDAQLKSMLQFGGESVQTERHSSCRVVNPFELDFLRAFKLANEENVPQATRKAMVARKIDDLPYKILRVPEVFDDFYLNLLSWSKENIVAVGVGGSVYLWNPANGAVQCLVAFNSQENFATSVKWCSLPGFTHFIAVGTKSSAVLVFDAQTLQKVVAFNASCSFIESLDWNSHLGLLTFGSKDGSVCNFDPRGCFLASKYVGHDGHVCGLSWNADGSCLASGGGDDTVCLWDAYKSNYQHHHTIDRYSPRFVLRGHKAAVKALAWCPFRRGLLATGGGTADQCVKLWESSTGVVKESFQTGSQVSSLLWSKTHHMELYSGHGYNDNHICVWSYPSMNVIKRLKGHGSRILSMDMSPEGSSIVSLGGDATLRFWGVGSEERRTAAGIPLDPFGGPTIR